VILSGGNVDRAAYARVLAGESTDEASRPALSQLS
jgi:hypothetical protein